MYVQSQYGISAFSNTDKVRNYNKSEVISLHIQEVSFWLHFFLNPFSVLLSDILKPLMREPQISIFCTLSRNNQHLEK